MSATAKLAPSDANAGDEFGTSVAISVNTVLVGAQGVANRTGRPIYSLVLVLVFGTAATRDF